MSKIRIKNFGPIKEGYQEEGGWMDIKKVTVFIGNQGSGKSTVAKVASTLTWMEKALNRGDIEEPKSFVDFHSYFKYQGIKDYFNLNTIIEYYGSAFNILYSSEGGKPYILTHKNSSANYVVPKISYVPAERNFLSVIKNATGVRGLPEPLFDFAEELKIGQTEIQDKEILLPINDVFYKYDKDSGSSFIIGKDFRVNLLFASSGFQSLVPLFLVTSMLANRVANGTEVNPYSINVTQSIRMNEQITKIMLDIELSNSEKIERAKEIQSRYLNKCFINVVEEPEQNLFPTSQWQMLQKLLEFNNLSEANKLIITTHSPYIINYLSIAIEGASLRKKMDPSNVNHLIKLYEIVPENSMANANDVVVYQLEEKDGTIRKLPTFDGIPSDKNYLNMMIRKGNEKFDSLLELEEEI